MPMIKSDGDIVVMMRNEDEGKGIMIMMTFDDYDDNDKDNDDEVWSSHLDCFCRYDVEDAIELEL